MRLKSRLCGNGSCVYDEPFGSGVGTVTSLAFALFVLQARQTSPSIA